MLFLGIDGGGTKTEFALCDDKGRIYSNVIKESASYWQFSTEKLLTVIKDGVDSVLKESQASYNDIVAVGFGMAGLGENPQKDEESINICKRYFKDIPMGIRNDVEVCFIASLAFQPGINVVAGTGAMAFGEDEKGNDSRCGGWGHEIGDEGSGYWLGKKTMELFTKQSDGRLPKTYLFDLVKEKMNIQSDFDVMDIFQKEYYNSRTNTASLQNILYDAAALEDGYAIKAYQDAAEELAMLPIAIRNKLSFKDTVKVSYSGGVFRAGHFILDPFKNRLEEMGFKVCDPLLTPVQGAILLAASQINKQQVVLENLTATKI